MEPQFLIPGFNITFVQSKTDAFLQLVEFKKIFPQVILLSLLVTVILSIYFIRKSLEPLKVLKEGTRQIASKNFNHRVEIDSRDEFEELAGAFNQMAIQLNDQFNTLETNAQITRSVLSSLETQRILDTVISRMTDCFSCEAAGIGLLRSDQADEIANALQRWARRQGVAIRTRSAVEHLLVAGGGPAGCATAICAARLVTVLWD